MYRWKARVPLPHWVHPSELYHRTGSRSPCNRDWNVTVNTRSWYMASLNGFYADYICYIPASVCIPKSTLKQREQSRLPRRPRPAPPSRP